MADTSEVLIYQTDDGKAALEARLDHETVWLSLTQITALFERDKSVISRHLKNIYSSGELDASATIAKNATVQTEWGENGYPPC